MPVPIVPYSTALVGCTPTIGISSLCKTVDTSTKPPISYSLRITLYLQPTIKGHVLGTLIIYGALGHNLTLLSRDCELFIETRAFSGSWRSILSGTDLPKGARRQLVCCGCRNLLLYAPGATSVCCSVCNVVTSVPPSGAQMAQLICSGCHTQLMYIRSANSVQCPCCHTVNLALQENQVAHVNCGNCCMLLMYRRGGRSVKCAVCNFVTPVGV